MNRPSPLTRAQTGTPNNSGASCAIRSWNRVPILTYALIPDTASSTFVQKCPNDLLGGILPLDVDNGVILDTNYFSMFNGTWRDSEALSILVLTGATVGAGGNDAWSIKCGLYNVILKALAFISSSCNLGNNRFTRLTLA